MTNSGEAQIIRVEWQDRWQVYYRLRDLEIKCFCQSNQPLKVDANHPQAVIQIWSVAKSFTANRRQLIEWLNDCWQMPSHR